MTQAALQTTLNPTPQSGKQPQMRIVIVGHVDHGKSTLVGRLLHDTGSLPEGKFEAIEASCNKRGMPFEWSFLLDALQAERDQAITIDTTQIWFSSALRRYNIIDAPGHREFLKNMITGAASAEAAVLVIDAEEGVKEQSKRHGYLLHMLGIRQVIVAVNKMDLVGYDQLRFEEIEQEYRAYLSEIGVTPLHVIPVSGREGDNIANSSDQAGWYKGPSIVSALDEFVTIQQSNSLPLRFMVQDVYKFDARRIIAGRIETGSVKVGDELLFAPGQLKGTVNTIESWPSDAPKKTEVYAGQSVGITLEEQIFVERGQVGCHAVNAPLISDQIRARIFWLSNNPLLPGERYTLKIGTAQWMAEVKQVVQVLDTDDLGHFKQTQVKKNQVAEVVLRIRGRLAYDDYAASPTTGRFVLLDGYHIAGGGIIYFDGNADITPEKANIKSENIYAEDYLITPEDRKRLNGHTGGVLWFTGLSGSGKSTLAKELQNQLFYKGFQVYVLDGDNVRHGLCSDLGFSPEDRTENIRRVGEVASLFADAGCIVITAFISPSQEDRRKARASTEHYFNIVHIDADLETCEQRDVKGLYKKARAGEIKEFTGVSAPYEPPEQADLVVDTVKYSIDECVSRLLEYVEKTYCK